MERYKGNIETKHNWHGIRNIALALGLVLGISNFSYSQENGGNHFDKTEQINESGKKSFEAYKIRVENRDNNIINNTNENLNDFSDRLKNQFKGEFENGSNIMYKIYKIKDILNNEYNQNLTNNDTILIPQMALKFIANMEKYGGINEYSDKFSGKFDLNFINAIGYIQYINGLSCNGALYGENGEMTLDKIIEDLSNRGNNGFIQNYGQYHYSETTHQKVSPKTNESSNLTSKTFTESNIDTKVNRIHSDYSTKVEQRNKNITDNTSETLDGFANRMHDQFKFEIDNKNSLVSRKIGNIEKTLNEKFNINLSNADSVAIIQSALIELSKTEKYSGLQEYTNNFSGKFDLNFVNAYGYVQYINDWSYNWSLCGNNGAFILQSIYDDLSNSEQNNGKDNNIENNGGNHDNTVQHDNTIKHDNTAQPNNDVDSDISRSTDNNVPNIEPDYREMEGVSLLSKGLSSDKLNGITYEDVWNTVDGFKHEGLKNAVMNCLLHNDVIGAQRLLGMDINCNRNRYPNYVACTKLGQRELNLMEKLGESRRYMDTQEILNFMERVEKAYEIENYEVKTIYLKFLSGELSNDGLPYCIISKYDYRIYLFSADHKLLACQSVLTGAHIGNNKNNPMNGSHTTPGGMYVMGGAFDKSSEGKNLISVYGTDYLVLLPKENQYNYGEEYSMGIHGYVKGREWRFNSQNTIDHRVSNGCINMDRSMFGEIINHLKTGSKVYVCKDDEM